MYSKIVNIIYVNIQKNLYRYSIKRIIILNESVIKKNEIRISSMSASWEPDQRLMRWLKKPKKHRYLSILIYRK